MKRSRVETGGRRAVWRFCQTPRAKPDGVSQVQSRQRGSFSRFDVTGPGAGAGSRQRGDPPDTMRGFRVYLMQARRPQLLDHTPHAISSLGAVGRAFGSGAMFTPQPDACRPPFVARVRDHLQKTRVRWGICRDEHHIPRSSDGPSSRSRMARAHRIDRRTSAAPGPLRAVIFLLGCAPVSALAAMRESSGRRPCRAV